MYNDVLTDKTSVCVCERERKSSQQQQRHNSENDDDNDIEERIAECVGEGEWVNVFNTKAFSMHALHVCVCVHAISSVHFPLRFSS